MAESQEEKSMNRIRGDKPGRYISEKGEKCIQMKSRFARNGRILGCDMRLKDIFLDHLAFLCYFKKRWQEYIRWQQNKTKNSWENVGVCTHQGIPNFYSMKHWGISAAGVFTYHASLQSGKENSKAVTSGHPRSTLSFFPLAPGSTMCTQGPRY